MKLKLLLPSSRLIIGIKSGGGGAAGFSKTLVAISGTPQHNGPNDKLNIQHHENIIFQTSSEIV
jgi:hypothetical protein